MSGIDITVSGAAGLLIVAKQLPLGEKFNEALRELENNQEGIASLQLDTPILQAKFDKIERILRAVIVDASPPMAPC